MRAILGLGNPDFKYEHTRHNIGFTILDLFAQKYNLKKSPGKGDFYFMKGNLSDESFILVKPITYMNLSGIAARQIYEQFQISIEDMLVVSDDVNLDVGKIRIRKTGGDGGHNGIKSIIYHLESNKFPRLRFGIGKDFSDGELADYVLSKFDKNYISSLKPSLDLCVSLIEEFIKEGIPGMLNYFSKNPQNFSDGKSKD